jgi:hypothetical protein
MNRAAPDPSSGSAPSLNTDGRDGRVVGKNDDNVLESIGKSVIAPIEGADEGAEAPDGEPGRAFTDLTRTLPQGEAATRDPTTPTPKGTAH